MADHEENVMRVLNWLADTFTMSSKWEDLTYPVQFGMMLWGFLIGGCFLILALLIVAGLLVLVQQAPGFFAIILVIVAVAAIAPIIIKRLLTS